MFPYACILVVIVKCIYITHFKRSNIREKVRSCDNCSFNNDGCVIIVTGNGNDFWEIKKKLKFLITRRKNSQKTISFCGATLLNNGLINIRLFKTWEVFKKWKYLHTWDNDVFKERNYLMFELVMDLTCPLVNTLPGNLGIG